MTYFYISPQIESSPEKKMRLQFFLISSPGGSKLDQVDSDFHKTMLIFWKCSLCCALYCNVSKLENVSLLSEASFIRIPTRMLSAGFLPLWDVQSPF